MFLVEKKGILGHSSSFSSHATYHDETPKYTFKMMIIKLSNGGLYKCRMDYHLEQASFQLIDLLVILPPEKPRIFYDTKQVKSNRLHVTENQSVTLICESKGRHRRI